MTKVGVKSGFETEVLDRLDGMIQAVDRLTKEVDRLGFNDAVPTAMEPFGAIEGLTVKLCDKLDESNAIFERIAESLEQLIEESEPDKEE